MLAELPQFEGILQSLKDLGSNQHKALIPFGVHNVNRPTFILIESFPSFGTDGCSDMFPPLSIMRDKK